MRSSTKLSILVEERRILKPSVEAAVKRYREDPTPENLTVKKMLETKLAAVEKQIHAKGAS